MENLADLLEIEDLWCYLKKQNKPIILYGMGDGADKILDVCMQKQITVKGVMASDAFVRNQTFRGFTVKKHSELKSELGDMIILVSFASRLKEVLDNIYSLVKYDEVYAPDVPVFGTGIFDSVFFKENFDKFNKVYACLSDDISRKTYFNIIKYKLTGNIFLLKECETSVQESYESIICPKKSSVYVDIGAYTGDTIKEYMSYAGRNISVFAFEPDTKNYEKLTKCVKDLDLFDTKLYNIAAWDKNETLTFYSRSGRNSAHTTSHKNLKEKKISADRADAYIDKKVDFINIDAEGSDKMALIGLSETISKYKPVVLCAVYHRSEDMFEIPLFLMEKYEKFELYIRHFPYIPAWDTNIYIKPI